MRYRSFVRPGGTIRRHVAGFVITGIALLLATPAHAAGGGASSGDLAVVVGLVAVVGVAYLLTHFVVDWLQKLFLVATSVEYLVAGLLLGFVLVPDPSTKTLLATIQRLPVLENLPWPQPLEIGTVAPLIALAAGWVGLLYGMALDIPTLVSQRDGAMRLAVLEGLLVGGLVCIGAYVLLDALVVEDIGYQARWLCAGLLGITAWAGSTSAMDVVRRRYQVEGNTMSCLVRAAQYSDMLAVLAFGVLFCLFHGAGSVQGTDVVAAIETTGRTPSAAEWSMITAGIGIVLGGLFAWFLDEDDSQAGTFLALVGIIAFASGAAFFLDLSALTINLILGMVLVSISRSGEKVRETLQGTLKPMSLLLLLLAGALWDAPPILLTVGLVAAVLGLRTLGKVTAGWTASLGTGLRRDSFRGLIGQGEVTIAMAISFKLVYDVTDVVAQSAAVDGVIDATYTAILVGVVVHEIIAPRVLKGLLVDAGEITAETGAGG